MVSTIPIVQACYEFLLRYSLFGGLLGSALCLLSARLDWAPPRYGFGTYFW